MGLTDDPIYKNMIEGEDTHILIGTLTTRMRSPNKPDLEVLPVFLVDYYSAPAEMEKIIAKTFDPVKKINLIVKNGIYKISTEERGTVLIFAEGETVAHTAPDWWAEYTPRAQEHEAFHGAYVRTGVWVLMVITKLHLREHLVDQGGYVVFKRTLPLTDELKKMLKIEG